MKKYFVRRIQKKKNHKKNDKIKVACNFTFPYRDDNDNHACAGDQNDDDGHNVNYYKMMTNDKGDSMLRH